LFRLFLSTQVNVCCFHDSDWWKFWKMTFWGWRMCLWPSETSKVGIHLGYKCERGWSAIIRGLNTRDSWTARVIQRQDSIFYRIIEWGTHCRNL
jgi:hypothetical protein